MINNQIDLEKLFLKNQIIESVFKKQAEDLSRAVELMSSIIQVTNAEKAKLQKMNKDLNKKYKKLKKSVKQMVKEYEDKI